MCPCRPRLKAAYEGRASYAAAKQAKLQAQFSEGQTGDALLTGLTFHVNGYTQPGLAELRRLVLAHGGRYQPIYSARVTHLLASRIPNVSSSRFLHATIVRPEWLLDSIKAGRKLPLDAYRVVRLAPGQRSLDKVTLNQGRFTDVDEDKEIAPLDDAKLTTTEAILISSDSEHEDESARDDGDKGGEADISMVSAETHKAKIVPPLLIDQPRADPMAAGQLPMALGQTSTAAASDPHNQCVPIAVPATIDPPRSSRRRKPLSILSSRFFPG